ncbi:MAG: hypothetical protein ACTSRH_08630 [Promethearchaeota archaeon]
MEQKVISKRKARKCREYKGKAPFHFDQFIFWLARMIFQVIIFSSIYFYNIDGVREQYQNNIIVELIYMLSWLIFTDILATLIAFIIKAFILYKLRYVSNPKKRNYGQWLWEYVIYTLLRGLIYLFGWTNLFAQELSRHVPSLLALILAWITISICTKLISKSLSIYINMK